MSLCYMFHKGRVILAGGGRVPERGEVPDCLAARFVNSGLVDRDGADGVWAGPSGAPTPAPCGPTAGDAGGRRQSGEPVSGSQTARPSVRPASRAVNSSCRAAGRVMVRQASAS